MYNTYVVDIDGTLCTIKTDDETYSDVAPIQPVIDKVNELYSKGHRIILFTARGMRTFNGNVDKINEYVRPILEKWLTLHNISYHELIMGKPWGPNVYYIDDRSVSIADFIIGK